jgi:hypothetical protein
VGNGIQAPTWLNLATEGHDPADDATMRRISGTSSTDIIRGAQQTVKRLTLLLGEGIISIKDDEQEE